MFVLVVLSLVALSFTYRTGLVTRMARHEVIKIKLEALSRSAASLALAELGRNTNDFDHPAETWSGHGPLTGQDGLSEWSAPETADEPEYITEYQVVDEDGKLNVMFASSEAMQKLGLTTDQIDSIFDWMDEDPVARAEGAEDEYYQALGNPYRTKNGGLEVLEELLLIKGVSGAAYFGDKLNLNRGLNRRGDSGFENVLSDGGDLQSGLINNFTAVGDGKINLNTAPQAVLETLPISKEAVSQIIGYRAFDHDSRGRLEDHVFRSAEDIDQLQGLNDSDREILLETTKFTSTYYRIHIQSLHLSTGLHYEILVLVLLSDQGIEVIQWRPG